jgi:hypothetical protein
MDPRRHLGRALLQSPSSSSLHRLLFESSRCNGIDLTLEGADSGKGLVYRLVQAVVLCCRLITPLSYLYLLRRAWKALQGLEDERTSPWTGAMLVYALAEAVFFLFYLYLFSQVRPHLVELVVAHSLCRPAQQPQRGPAALRFG